MKTKSLISVIGLMLCVLLVSFTHQAKAANDTIVFSKTMVSGNNSELFFNIAKIKNLSAFEETYITSLKLPKSWSVFKNPKNKYNIAAGDSISIPLRVKIGESAKADSNYKIILNLFNEEKQLINKAYFNVNVTPRHDWDVVVPKERIYFPPGSDRTYFDLKIINKGNVSDTVFLDIRPDRKIELHGPAETELPPYIILNSLSDTSLRLEAKFTYSEDRIFELSKIKIYASAQGESIYRNILIEKYSDEYNPFEIDNTLPHQAEAGIRTFNNNTEVLPFIKTRGRSKLSEESNFDYNFTYYDLTNTENIITNSYYNFLFNYNELKLGLGAFSSMLGRNLYNRNSLMFADKIKISRSGQLEGFASYGFIDDKAGAALAYHFNKKDINMTTSMAYDYDKSRKVNTASFIYHSNKIALAKNHILSAVLYAYDELHYRENKYRLNGIAYDLNYYGQLSKKIILQFSNSFGSPNMPGPQMGLLNFNFKISVATEKRKRYFTLKYVNTDKKFYYVSIEGIRLPDIFLHDKYASVLYHSLSGKIHRWTMGPSVELYKSRKPLDGNKYSIYTARKYRLEYRSFIGRHLSLSVKAGLGDLYFKETEEIKQTRYDFHFLGDLYSNGTGIRFAYDYGPMVNSGIYQFAIDASNNSLNISPYIMKQLFKGRVKLSLFGNLNYRFDMNYGTVNINPKIETYLFKDWYLTAGGTYTYYNQKYKGSNMEDSYYYTEFSIKKKWGKSDYKKWQKDLRRIKLVFFQDDNNNGEKDNFEKGIPYVKARLLLENSADQTVKREFPTDLSLLSNDKGSVIFARIPMGFYQLTITPLKEQNEYFYVDKTFENIEVTKTDVIYIPFKKASKIEGKISVNQRKYALEAEKIKDLANIKVTAFNNDGNTYSAFTKKDGSFILFAPGNNTYFLRISNVFGDNFRIERNDIKIDLQESANVIFNVIEKNRRIKFKSVNNKSEDENKLQKVKIVPGKIYANKEERLKEQNPLPEFNMKDLPADIIDIEAGKYYVLIARSDKIKTADEIVNIMRESGVLCRIGIDKTNNEYIIFTNYYTNKKPANTELKQLKLKGLKKVEVVKF